MKFFLTYILLLFLHPTPLAITDYEYKKIYEHNRLVSEGWEKDGKKEKYWKFYYKNGQIEREGHYLHNLKDSYWKYYFLNGEMQREGRFKKGLQEKWWLFYDQKGQVTIKCEFKHGKRHGYTFLYKNTELFKAEKYENDELKNSWTDYASFYRDN